MTLVSDSLILVAKYKLCFYLHYQNVYARMNINSLSRVCFLLSLPALFSIILKCPSCSVLSITATYVIYIQYIQQYIIPYS